MVSSGQFITWPCGSDTSENEPHGISGSDSQGGDETTDSSLESASCECCTIHLSAHKNNYNSSCIEKMGFFFCKCSFQALFFVCFVFFSQMMHFWQMDGRIIMVLVISLNKYFSRIFKGHLRNNNSKVTEYELHLVTENFSHTSNSCRYYIWLLHLWFIQHKCTKTSVHFLRISFQFFFFISPVCIFVKKYLLNSKKKNTWFLDNEDTALKYMFTPK